MLVITRTTVYNGEIIQKNEVRKVEDEDLEQVMQEVRKSLANKPGIQAVEETERNLVAVYVTGAVQVVCFKIEGD